MWSFVPSGQEDLNVTDTSSRSPVNVQTIYNQVYTKILNAVLTQARINVPAPSVRTIQRGIAVSNYTADSSIQVYYT